MSRSDDVTRYIEELEQAWQQEVCIRLRELVHQADFIIDETIKWGTPAFMHEGLVAWIFCAQNWVHFSFPHGAILDDSHGLFEVTTNKAQRTLKIHNNQRVPDKLIIQLVEEAVVNNLKGRKVVIPKTPKIEIELPRELLSELRSAHLEGEYFNRPYYQQKGYLQWIGQAKRSQTRLNRVNAMIDELKQGTYMPPKRDHKR